MPFEDERSKVAHLLRRAGFGYSAAELDQYTALGFQGAVDLLLNYDQVDDSSTDQLLSGLELDLTKVEDAKFWWLTRMLNTRRPLQEKMTLFWHTHFATAASKVGSAQLMLQQIQLFRDNALPNFEALLQKVTRDPAMLIWLDNRENRKGAPNENYAREVMELFTLGIGNYTEDDVKQGARAYTGYTLDKNKSFVFVARGHDAGQKTFLGQTGNFDADDALGILVRQPAAARFITGKLFRFFVYDSPSSDTLDRLAATYTSSGFDMRAVMRDILTGPEFLSPGAFHACVKQPVDLLVGSLKALDAQNVGRDATQILRRMGQDLLNPPDVSGWKGGSMWVNSSTLFERFSLANRLATARDAAKPYFVDVPGAISARGLSAPEDVVDYYLHLLVDDDATPEARQALLDYLNPDGSFSLDDDRSIDQKIRGMLHLVMSMPSYQLA